MDLLLDGPVDDVASFFNVKEEDMGRGDRVAVGGGAIHCPSTLVYY
jgi:hypothetical protein